MHYNNLFLVVQVEIPKQDRPENGYHFATTMNGCSKDCSRKLEHINSVPYQSSFPISYGDEVTLQRYRCEKNSSNKTECEEKETGTKTEISKNRESENEIARILQENFDLKKKNQEIQKV